MSIRGLLPTRSGHFEAAVFLRLGCTNGQSITNSISGNSAQMSPQTPKKVEASCGVGPDQGQGPCRDFCLNLED